MIRSRYAALTIVIVAAGLLCRWPALGLPWAVSKYGGSALWGAMVYFGLRTLWPSAARWRTTAAALALATAVEGSRLYGAPTLDAFRLTLAGRLLLGRVFSPWNLVAYAAGICAAALVDRRIERTSDASTCGPPLRRCARGGG